jgi:hypothetical protein
VSVANLRGLLELVSEDEDVDADDKFMEILFAAVVAATAGDGCVCGGWSGDGESAAPPLDGVTSNGDTTADCFIGGMGDDGTPDEDEDDESFMLWSRGW